MAQQISKGTLHGAFSSASHTAVFGRIDVLRIILSAVGLMMGLVTAVDAQSSVGGQRHRPTAEEIDRRLGEFCVAPSAPPFHDRDRAVQQLYDEIMHWADPALRQ
jgi:hypothetical protein